MSPPGYNGGFFNHYDDPDEFWDEDPLTPTQRDANSSHPTPITHPVPQPAEYPTPGTGPDRESSAPTWTHSDSFTAEDTQAAPGYSFATVEVDRGLLPIQLRLSSQWHRHVDPGDTGDELMRAYKKSVEACLGKLVTGEFRHACPVPDRRTVLMLLLDTSSWSEYREAQRRILTRGIFDVHGRALIDGAPAISIAADCFQLKSIYVRPEWAQKAHPMDLVAAAQTGDIVAAIGNAYNAIAQAVGSIASSAQNSIINGNKIAQASSDIDGLPDNKWPPMAVDDNSKFDDATVLDGTNKWSVKTDRVTQ